MRIEFKLTFIYLSSPIYLSFDGWGIIITENLKSNNVSNGFQWDFHYFYDGNATKY